MYGTISPERSRLLTGGDGPCLQALHGHEAPIAALAWSPDQQIIASGALDRSVGLWNVATGDCLFTLSGHQSYVRSVDFSPSGQQLISASGDGLIRRWDQSTRKILHEFHGCSDGVYHAVFDPCV
jgi:WD40 repeat protein